MLFVWCEDGKPTALDVVHEAKSLGSAETGKGVDIIAYSQGMGHLYVPGGDSATMAIIAVGASGDLKVLGTVPTAPAAHCVAADDVGKVVVDDPAGGRLLAYSATFTAARSTPK